MDKSVLPAGQVSVDLCVFFLSVADGVVCGVHLHPAYRQSGACPGGFSEGMNQ